jgi:hypothetical protein
MQHSLVAELSSSPGRFGLIEDGPGVEEVLAELEATLGSTRASVGASLTVLPEPPLLTQIEAMLGSASLFVEIEILFAPELAVDPVMLLRHLARIRSPRVALWPGSLEGGRARYSEARRPDHYDRPIDDVIILRPVLRAFPDEPCFAIERWMN